MPAILNAFATIENGLSPYDYSSPQRANLAKPITCLPSTTRPLGAAHPPATLAQEHPSFTTRSWHTRAMNFRNIPSPTRTKF